MLLALALGAFAGNPLDAGDASWAGSPPCPPVIVHAQDCVPCDPNPHIFHPGRPSAIPQPRREPLLLAPPQLDQTQPSNDSSSNQGEAPARPDSPAGIDDETTTPDNVPPNNVPQNNVPQDTQSSGANDFANNFDNISAADLQSSFASTQSSFSSAPSIIGDFIGGGLAEINAVVEQRYQQYAIGSGGIAPTFDVFPGGGFNPDIFSIGIGSDSDGSSDGFLDTYSIAEPLPPTDAQTAPGPGFQFQGGTAVYTGNTTDTTAQAGDPQAGDLWYLDYAYAQQLGGGGPGGVVGGPRPVPSPGVAVRRVKIAENFSAEIRNRGFVSYNFFNDSFGGLGDISRFMVGMEQVLVDNLLSVEARLPIAATYGSRQNLDSKESRNMEIGNLTLLAKVALLRTDNFLWSGGMGVGMPTADDTQVRFRGMDLVQIRNETVQIQPFTGMLLRWNDWVFQSYMQLDVAAGGDSVFINTNLGQPELGQLSEVGTFTDSTLLHLDFAINRIIYQTNQAKFLNAVIANAELHYTSTLQDADIVRGAGFTYTNLQPNFDIVNATTGLHLVVGEKRNIVVTPAFSVPLTSGLNQQSDYEAMLQVNYIR